MQAGDRILQIDDINNPTWEQVSFKVMLSPDQPLNVEVQRGNQTFEKTINPQTVAGSRDGYGSAGWYADESVIVGPMEANMPAAKAGIQEGDKIVAIERKAMPSIETMIDSFQETKRQASRIDGSAQWPATHLSGSTGFGEDRRSRDRNAIALDFKTSRK